MERSGALFVNNDILDILIPFIDAIVIIAIIVLIMYTIFLWRIFEKAGMAGWRTLIPLHGTWCFNKMVFGSGWFMVFNFTYLFQNSDNVLISMLGSLAVLGFAIAQMVMLAKVFGKGKVFTVGLIFLPLIFLGILAFDRSEYEGEC
jgi:hypothetical protein